MPRAIELMRRREEELSKAVLYLSEKTNGFTEPRIVLIGGYGHQNEERGEGRSPPRVAMERNLLGDPDVILKLYDEARRRWGHLMSRYGLGKIVEAALLKMKVEKKRESKSL